MKRDMDLIRDLLFRLESWPMERGDVVAVSPDAIATEGHSAHEIEYHLNLLKEARLVDFPTEWEAGFYFRALTWEGHDFLDSIRDPKVWAKTKSGAEAAGGFTVDLLKDLAKGLIKKQIEEYTGVKL
jgi:hypothetical protein